MSKARKVLILSYYFPPMGMGGTQRVAKFCKYLPEFGWSPVVVTVKPVAYYAHDTSLLDNVNAAEIHRTHSLDPLRMLALRIKDHSQPEASGNPQSRRNWRGNNLLNRLNALLNWLLVPDTKLLWLPFAIFRALKIMRRQQIDLIYTTSPPHSIHLAGAFLKRRTGKKWITDFRDDWSGGESQPCPTRLHLALNRYLEKLILKESDAIVGICRQLVDTLYNKSISKHATCKVITNGFDADDFKSDAAIIQSAKFTIVHCGSISNVSTPEPFLAALDSVFRQHPRLRANITVKFIGVDVFGKLTPLLEKYRLHDVVEFTPYLPHRMAIEQMLRAHVLLLLVTKKTGEEVITSKVFEYLASGRRILAIIPSGELAEILTSARAGKIIADNQHVYEIANAILAFYQDYLNKKLDTKPTDFITRYERKYLTRELATLFDELWTSGSNI
ncbi:glycosyltransferase [candidate division KSB1 bacterium]|nr:glycosyltransferase [candidate division KSB1 bacterium]